jgi:hypothetical protein
LLLNIYLKFEIMSEYDDDFDASPVKKAPLKAQTSKTTSTAATTSAASKLKGTTASIATSGVGGAKIQNATNEMKNLVN